jgi:hypothetical protein
MTLPAVKSMLICNYLFLLCLLTFGNHDVTAGAGVDLSQQAEVFARTYFASMPFPTKDDGICNNVAVSESYEQAPSRADNTEIRSSP